jgi:hypothetical protein
MCILILITIFVRFVFKIDTLKKMEHGKSLLEVAEVNFNCLNTSFMWWKIEKHEIYESRFPLPM